MTLDPSEPAAIPGRPGDPLRGRHVVLGVTGSIACYKAIDSQELVAKDSSHYVELAGALGADPGLRARLRAEFTSRSAALYQNEATVIELADFLRAETRAG